MIHDDEKESQYFEQNTSRLLEKVQSRSTTCHQKRKGVEKKKDRKGGDGRGVRPQLRRCTWPGMGHHMLARPCVDLVDG